MPAVALADSPSYMVAFPDTYGDKLGALHSDQLPDKCESIIPYADLRENKLVSLSHIVIIRYPK